MTRTKQLHVPQTCGILHPTDFRETAINECWFLPGSRQPSRGSATTTVRNRWYNEFFVTALIDGANACFTYILQIDYPFWIVS